MYVFCRVSECLTADLQLDICLKASRPVNASCLPCQFILVPASVGDLQPCTCLYTARKLASSVKEAALPLYHLLRHDYVTWSLMMEQRVHSSLLLFLTPAMIRMPLQ